MPYSQEQWNYYSLWSNFSKEKDLQYSSEQFDYFLQRIKTNNPFSLIRFGEGESRVAIGEQVLSRTELTFSPNEKTQSYVLDLIASAKINLPNYYIGIQSYTFKPGESGRPLDEFTEQRRKIYELGKFDYERYTCSRIFCNFPDRCLNEMVPELKKYNCYFVGSKNTVPNKLLKFNQSWFIEPKDAWKKNTDMYEIIGNAASSIKDSVFIICGGFFANTLISKIAHINNNFYINVGSVFDPIIMNKHTRSYQKNYPIYGKWK